jgi:hypothetical protein
VTGWTTKRPSVTFKRPDTLVVSPPSQAGSSTHRLSQLTSDTSLSEENDDSMAANPTYRRPLFAEKVAARTVAVTMKEDGVVATQQKRPSRLSIDGPMSPLVGARVSISGLQKRADLTGLRGDVTAFDEANDCFLVSVAGESLLIRPENLNVVAMRQLQKPPPLSEMRAGAEGEGAAPDGSDGSPTPTTPTSSTKRKSAQEEKDALLALLSRPSLSDSSEPPPPRAEESFPWMPPLLRSIIRPLCQCLVNKDGFRVGTYKVTVTETQTKVYYIKAASAQLAEQVVHDEQPEPDIYHNPHLETTAEFEPHPPGT